MLESERLAYLDALGISQFVAREPLDGAPSLPLLQPEQIWPSVDSDKKEAELETTHLDKGVNPKPAAEPDPLKPEPKLPSETEQGRVEAATETDATPVLDLTKLGLKEGQSTPTERKISSTRETRFALAIVDVADQFRVVVELALPDAPGLSAMEHRMLSDMLQLLGCGDWLSNHAPRTFQWPIVNNPRIAKDRSAARDGLMGFFASSAPWPKTLFLGPQAPSLLQQTELNPVAETLAPVQLDGLTGMTLVLPSFNQMQDWTLKRRCWQQIQAFLP